MARVTSADVARASGVSRTTVSYVLNGKDGTLISAATQERVRAAAARLGYAPSAAARILRSGRSDLVLCVLPDWPVGPVIDGLLDHLARELAERDLALLVRHGRGRQPLTELLRAVTPRAVLGLTAFAPDDERAMRQADVLVLTTTVDDGPSDSRVFAVSQLQIGRLQVQHLVTAGHRAIGYAAATDDRVRDFSEPRLAGVRAACAERGLPEPVVRPVEMEVPSAVAAVRAWRAAGVTAVAAYNDEVALAVLAGARAEGLAVPADVAVIGVDDVPLARVAAPPLTTIDQAIDVQAHHLAAHILSALDGRPPPERPAEVLTVVVRDSA